MHEMQFNHATHSGMSDNAFVLSPIMTSSLQTSWPRDLVLFTVRLCNEGAGGGTLVSPGWWKSTDGLVIAGETVDTGLDENETEFGVLVLAVALEMLADGDGLFDEHVKIFWDLWCETVRPQDAENLVSSDNLDLGNTMRIAQYDTDLGRCGAFSCEFDDLINDLIGRRLQPGWRRA